MTVDRRAAVLNHWLNSPEILPIIAPGMQTVDTSPFFDNPRNIMLEHKFGVSVWFYEGDGVYDGHYVFGPNLRGKEALDVARDMVNEVFTRYHAKTILGQVAVGNRPARTVTRALGFSRYGRGSVDTFNRPCVDYVLTRDEWKRQPWALKV